MTPNNLEWVDELLENMVCASHLLEKDGCLYCDGAKLKQTIATKLLEARIDELNKLALYRETNDKIDVDFVDWQTIENRLTTLQSTPGDKEQE